MQVFLGRRVTCGTQESGRTVCVWELKEGVEGVRGLLSQGVLRGRGNLRLSVRGT